MFSKQTYINRRRTLKEKVGSGTILIFGHNESPSNYPGNTYMFRQDSSFAYYFGQQHEGLAGVIDIDNDTEYLIGNDTGIDEAIWTGPVPSVRDLAEEVGITHTAPMSQLGHIIAASSHVNYLPPCRHDIMIQIGDLLGIHPLKVRDKASLPLIKAVIDMRTVKTDEEIAEIEKSITVGHLMHTTAMKTCRPGVTERHIAGTLAGIAQSHAYRESFPSIVTMHGEIMHNSPTDQPLEPGRLLLVDAGAESIDGYCSDHTRVTPVSGRFTQQQRDIYTIVEACHDLVIEKARPQMKWLDMHLDTCRLMTTRLKELGLMKGDTEEALRAGAHTLFLPHGLGHMMGMDVHDMEGLGQTHLGYDDEVRPSTEYGLSHLRCGRRVHPGWVMTDEPGIYFIPMLIDKWKAEGRCADYLNYDAIEQFRNFGGIRIEDDILITDTGCRVLGKETIPYHIDDVENFIN